MNCQRASGGTQKTLSARYSSRSSASAPFSFCNAACFSSKASEMYFRKMRPRTTCLYSAASIWPRSLSAAAQSVASRRGSAPLDLLFRALVGKDNSAASSEVTLRRRNGASNQEEFPVSAESGYVQNLSG